MSSVEAIYIDGVFRPTKPVDLPEGERVDLQIKRQALTQEEAEALLNSWSKVYEGLSEQDVEEIEAAMLDRSRFLRDRSEE